MSDGVLRAGTARLESETGSSYTQIGDIDKTISEICLANRPCASNMSLLNRSLGHVKETDPGERDTSDPKQMERYSILPHRNVPAAVLLVQTSLHDYVSLLD